MSQSVDKERAEISVDFRIERSKRILRQMMAVQGLWLEGLPISDIARRLGMRRDRVYWIQRALQLCDGEGKVGRGVKRPPAKTYRPSQPGHLYGLQVPPIGDGDAP